MMLVKINTVYRLDQSRRCSLSTTFLLDNHHSLQKSYNRQIDRCHNHLHPNQPIQIQTTQTQPTHTLHISDHPMASNSHYLPHPNIFEKRHSHHRSHPNPSHDFPPSPSSPVLPAARSRKPQVGYTGIEFWAATGDLEAWEGKPTNHPPP